MLGQHVPPGQQALVQPGDAAKSEGQPARTLPLLRNAMRLDPVGGYLYYLVLGRAYFFQDDLEQALINLREAVSRVEAYVRGLPGSADAH